MDHEYPEFSILGETWLQKESITAYYAKSENERFGYNSLVGNVTDFPLHYAIEKAFHEEESWTEGLARIYYVLAQDFLYDTPNNNVIFADNHDLSRFYTVMKHDIRKYQMGIAFLLTTRGIPMIYYGTEILMEGEESAGHGFIREDFPGGWKGDRINAFKGKGLNDEQELASEYLRHLLHWRKNNAAVQTGRLTHFIPDSGVYVYFRTIDKEVVMVVMNNNEESVEMPALERFDECLLDKRSGLDVMQNERVENIQLLTLKPKSVMIFEIEN
jgi:glycosidase